MRLQTKFEDYILLYIYIILYYITYNTIDYLLLHWKSPNTKYILFSRDFHEEGIQTRLSWAFCSQAYHKPHS